MGDESGKGRGRSAWGRELRRHDGGLRVEVVRGRRPGKTLWVWIPAGAKAPSMVQAAAELRDRLDPALLRGEVAFLLDGPLLRDEARSGTTGGGRAAGPLRQVTAGAAAVVALVEGPGEQVARLELDVDDAAARHLARATAVPLLVNAPRGRVKLEAPLLVLVDGTEHPQPTIDGAVRTRATAVLDGIAAALQITKAVAPSPPAPPRVVLRKRVTVNRGTLPGSAEVCAAIGDVVRAGEVLALVGPPGFARQPVLSPVSGVVLSADRSTGGPLIVLAKAERTLRRAEQALGVPPTERHRVTIGWCEWVALPELGVERIKAKIDTGARTCALHVVSLTAIGEAEGGRPVLEVGIPVGRRDRMVKARCEVVDHASVRDSGGHLERRPVVETTLVVAGITRRVRVSLTDRGDMLFPMLIGRTALGSELLVDPSTRFRLGPGR